MEKRGKLTDTWPDFIVIEFPGQSQIRKHLCNNILINFRLVGTISMNNEVVFLVIFSHSLYRFVKLKQAVFSYQLIFSFIYMKFHVSGIPY